MLTRSQSTTCLQIFSEITLYSQVISKSVKVADDTFKSNLSVNGLIKIWNYTTHVPYDTWSMWPRNLHCRYWKGPGSRNLVRALSNFSLELNGLPCIFFSISSPACLCYLGNHMVTYQRDSLRLSYPFCPWHTNIDWITLTFPWPWWLPASDFPTMTKSSQLASQV